MFTVWKFVDKRQGELKQFFLYAGVLKDYLRELPEPLFTKGLFDMLVDGFSVCLPDDPEGNAKLMFSILDCLPKVNRVCITFFSFFGFDGSFKESESKTNFAVSIFTGIVECTFPLFLSSLANILILL